MKKNLYELLEVLPDANQEEIKVAMIRLGKKYATEIKNNKTAHIHYERIKQAYNILSNPYRRAGYDNALKRKNLKKKGRSRFLKWVIQKWYLSQQGISEKWQIGKHFIQKWQFGNPQTDQKWKIGKPIKGWKIFKPQPTTKYIRHTLIPGERILYQTYPHWFFYFDLVGVLFFILSGYLLGHDPLFMGEDMPTVTVWVPSIFSKESLEISVWRLGMLALFLVTLMVVWEAFVDNHTTELVISSRRVIYKRGLLRRIMIELKLGQFESIIIDQTALGRVFDYGTITITGVGCVKTTIPHIVAPLQFKKRLWQILEIYGEGMRIKKAENQQI